MRYNLFLLLFLLISTIDSNAQDIHFSQFDYTGVNLSPAQTGLYQGDYRVNASHRSQWHNVPVSYQTTAFSFDAHLLPYRTGKNILAGGLIFYYDQAGDSRLSKANIGLSLAYHKRIAKHFLVGVGAQIDFAQRNFETKALTFDDQFNGDFFVPSIVSQDMSTLADNTTFNFADYHTGVNLRWQLNRRNFADVGTALYHLTRPQQSFLGEQLELPQRLSVFSQASIQFHPKMDLLPTIWYQTQGISQEFVAGLGLRYHLNPNPGREVAIDFRALHRLKDALILKVGVDYQRLHVGLSYDINTSGFITATNRQGGFEIAVQYIWAKVPELPSVKTCPTF